MSLLERNLEALARSSPDAAAAVRAATPPAGLEWLDTPEGPSATLAGEDGRTRSLASRRAPRTEAGRLAEGVDIARHPAIVVLGFGLGYHIEAIAQRVGRSGVVLVFEPDVGVLRAVLERLDCAAWLARSNVAVLHDAEDAGAMHRAIRGVEGVVASGVELVEHPPSMPRLGARAARFGSTLAVVLKGLKTTVVTTLMQAEVTMRNGLQNLDRYATSAGVADLAGAARGFPAVCVAAGPSLARNVALLARPGVRERCVIIAAQTVLKPLLARGIRPHFVTALDYHEISRRFYEGLTAQDVEGVTLVAEPKANPAILDAWPGALRMPGDDWLDTLLGDLATPKGALAPGATVAHLSYYLARHLGCDPAILVGQDLAFTDGQYYAAGAAIHRVWMGELGVFNTLEMLEWQRIVRMRRHLVAATDHLGRPVYTDEQMASYALQFEEAFARDAARELTTLDATEGGLAKRHTRSQTLAAALGALPERTLELPATGSSASAARLELVTRRVRAVRGEALEVARLSRETDGLLREMGEHQQDQRRVNDLITRAHRNGTRVRALSAAYALTEHINQTGALKRFRADRAIQLDAGASEMDRQRAQIERDRVNVRWIAEAADRVGELLEQCLETLGGKPRITRDPPPPMEEPAAGPVQVASRPRVVAVLPADPDRSSLGRPRPLGEPLVAGLNLLQMTLRRLARCARLDGVVVLARDPEAIRTIMGEAPDGLRVEVMEHPDPFGPRHRATAAARLMNPHAWRGGLGNLTVYDELLHPSAVLAALEQTDARAALLLGPDWVMVDPALVDAVADRFAESPDRHRLVFTQAAPGLAPCLLERSLLEDLDRGAGEWPASVGGLLAYLPPAPRHDPIASGHCLPVPELLRDACLRCVPDSAARRRAVGTALLDAGEDALRAPAAELVAALADHRVWHAGATPRHLVLELCTGRRAAGQRALWLSGVEEPAERPMMEPALAERLLRQQTRVRADAVLTLDGAGDPLLHPGWREIVAAARRAGVACVHVRTDLLVGERTLEALLEPGVGPDIISVDLLAHEPRTYRTLTGADAYALARGNLEALLARRGERGGSGLPMPWIVPRITRCDAVYGQIEAFYDHWLVQAGACVIDPLPRAIVGERIEPLPVPEAAARSLARDALLVLSDGSAMRRPTDLAGAVMIGNLREESLADVWRRSLGVGGVPVGDGSERGA